MEHQPHQQHEQFTNVGQPWSGESSLITTISTNTMSKSEKVLLFMLLTGCWLLVDYIVTSKGEKYYLLNCCHSIKCCYLGLTSAASVLSADGNDNFRDLAGMHTNGVTHIRLVNSNVSFFNQHLSHSFIPEFSKYSEQNIRF